MLVPTQLRSAFRPLAGAALLALLLFTARAPLARAQDEGPKPIAIGSEIPMADVKMKDVDGDLVAIADVRGKKGTLVLFSCNACPWVKAWEERMVAIGNRWPARGVGVIAINANDPAVNGEDDYPVMQARAKQRGMKYAYVVDATSDVARAFGASRTPEAFLFDAEGRLVYHGAIDDNAREPAKVKERYLDQALAAVASGKAIATAETKSLGCTIKFRKKA